MVVQEDLGKAGFTQVGEFGAIGLRSSFSIESDYRVGGHVPTPNRTIDRERFGVKGGGACPNVALP